MIHSSIFYPSKQFLLTFPSVLAQKEKVISIAFRGSRISLLRYHNWRNISFLLSYSSFGSFVVFFFKPSVTLSDTSDQWLHFDRLKTVDFTACCSLNINEVQKETLLEILGWCWQSNDSQQICSVLLCLYYRSIRLLILGILNPQSTSAWSPSWPYSSSSFKYCLGSCSV